jgi:hypothetical protein
MSAARDPLGKQALFWAGNDGRDPRPDELDEASAGRRALFSAPTRRPGTLAVDCSSCGMRSRVTYAEFIRRHFPFWLWLPGRRFSRLLGCPSCGRRTWLAVSWRI